MDEWFTVEYLMHNGYSREEAEREIQRANCTHEYAPYKGGTLCMWTAFGCSRTCVKCGQTTVDPNHCGQYVSQRQGHATVVNVDHEARTVTLDVTAGRTTSPKRDE